MVYFAILGKHPEISKAELEWVQPKNISYPKKWIIIFDTEYPEKLTTLGGIIKAGRVVKEKELPTLLTDIKIIGIQSETNGKHLKRTAGIRRYKLVNLFHTDKEIKEKGKELINLENGLYGIVEYYQPIELYETIDFSKPGRSMQMGMMPAKLTHIMINIWLTEKIENCEVQRNLGKLKTKWNEAQEGKIENLCMYDPFVGSGTTGFLANYLGYDFIGSDIKITYAQQNADRRKTTKFYDKNHTFDIFTHDIKGKFWQTPLIKGQTKRDLLIITEWRLWPIVTKTTWDQDIQKFQERVADLYKSFLERIQELSATAVFTIPRYIGQENGIEQVLNTYTDKIGLKIQSIPELYMREGQQVARKILIVK